MGVARGCGSGLLLRGCGAASALDVGEHGEARAARHAQGSYEAAAVGSGNAQDLSCHSIQIVLLHLALGVRVTCRKKEIKGQHVGSEKGQRQVTCACVRRGPSGMWSPVRHAQALTQDDGDRCGQGFQQDNIGIQPGVGGGPALQLGVGLGPCPAPGLANADLHLGGLDQAGHNVGMLVLVALLDGCSRNDSRPWPSGVGWRQRELASRRALSEQLAPRMPGLFTTCSYQASTPRPRPHPRLAQC